MGLKIDNYSVDQSIKHKSTTDRKGIDWSAWLQKDIQLFGSGLSLKQKEAFYAELEVLLSAGLDLKRSLAIISGNKKKKRDKDLLQEIEQTIINGASLSEAIRSTGKFSDYEVFSIQIGEESGQLIAVLKELSNFYTKSIKYKQQLLSALAYPGFVISFAFLVVFFLLKYLVPLFSDIYKRLDGKLPTITQHIMDLSDWLGNYSIYLFLVFALLFLGLYQQRQRIWFRRVSTSILLGSPIFGPIIQKIYLSRLAQSMFLLLHAKVPLLKAVQLVRKMISFYPIEDSLNKTEEDILQGRALHESLAKSKFYPSPFIALLQVGEEANTLDEMFQRLAQQYTEEVEQQTALISSLLEPILIISLGILVGIILVAMYMPLFQMSVGIQ